MIGAEQKNRIRAHIRAQRRRRCKREAREVLAFRQNYLNVLFAILAFLFFVGCAVFFADCFYKALLLSDIAVQNERLIYGIFRVLSAIILFLLLSPLYAGVTAYLVDVYHTRSANIGHVPQSALFCFYANVESAVRAWAIVLIRLVGVALFLLATQVVFIIAKQIFPFFQRHNIIGAAIGVCVVIAFALLLLIAVLASDFCFKAFFIYAIMHPSEALASCMRATASHAFRSLREGVLLQLSFTPWMIASALSAGVLLVLYVLPYILFSEISYFVHLMMEANKT